MAARVETGVARIGKNRAGHKRFRAFRQFHFHDVIVFKDRAFEHVAVDVAGISVGHEQRVRSDGGAVSAKNSHLMVGEIERLRLRVLEEAHAALAQCPRQSDEKLARTKAAAEAIDHATGVKSLGGAVAPLSCRAPRISKNGGRRLSASGISARRLLFSMKR